MPVVIWDDVWRAAWVPGRSPTNAAFGSPVHHYDEFGYDLQDRSARIQLQDIALAGKRVLDVGCGTGALAAVALEQGAREVARLVHPNAEIPVKLGASAVQPRVVDAVGWYLVDESREQYLRYAIETTVALQEQEVRAPERGVAALEVISLLIR